MTESLWSTMNVRSPKPWGTKLGVTKYFRFTVDMSFVLNFTIKFDVCMIGCIVYSFSQTGQTDCFHRVHKILQCIGSNDFIIMKEIASKLTLPALQHCLAILQMPCKCKWQMAMLCINNGQSDKKPQSNLGNIITCNRIHIID